MLFNRVVPALAVPHAEEGNRKLLLARWRSMGHSRESRVGYLWCQVATTSCARKISRNADVVYVVDMLRAAPYAGDGRRY